MGFVRRLGAMLGVGRGRDARPSTPEVELRRGTRQASLVAALERHVAELHRLRTGDLPDSVLDEAISAVVAAEGTLETARSVAAAVDGLDDALRRSQPAAGREPRGEVRASMERMSQRRHELMAKLQHSVDAVATVHTKLLEATATWNAFAVDDEGLREIDAVGESIDELRTTLAELEET
jgi:hypothetical protein